MTSDRPGTARGSDRATVSEGTSSLRDSPDPGCVRYAARKGRAPELGARDSRILLVRSGERGCRPARRFKPAGETSGVPEGVKARRPGVGTWASVRNARFAAPALAHRWVIETQLTNSIGL